MTTEERDRIVEYLCDANFDGIANESEQSVHELLRGCEEMMSEPSPAFAVEVATRLTIVDGIYARMECLDFSMFWERIEKLRQRVLEAYPASDSPELHDVLQIIFGSLDTHIKTQRDRSPLG